MIEKTILLQNGLVYANGKLSPGDVRIGEGRDIERVDCEGLVISPGFTDLHVHLREPGFSRKETIRTGTLAAAAGGFTTVCAMPNLSPVPDSLENLRAQLDIIERSAHVEVLPYGAITRGEEGKELADFEALAPYCVGFSDDGRGVQSRGLMKEAMLRAKAVDRLIAAHCEDERYEATDSRSEWKMIERDIELAAETGARYHVCHVSAKESIALLRQAKAQGLPITCECTPHQLLLCADDADRSDGRFKMNPPLRTVADRKAIVRGLLDGTIDCIATDHAPHTAEEKSGGFAMSANGVVGLETALAACYTALVRPGLCTLAFLLEKLTDAPSRILRRACGIRPGHPENLVILNPNTAERVVPERFRSMGRSSPFAGRVLTGSIVATYYRGQRTKYREETDE